ncbi:transmembrane protein 59 [Elysia marginata]|uniref:Transmembrane protein 59 n=1 Tax=Elysia marginata TaxID=1093978 RepID=A0AAV4F565_9GAST|nr:transmembrane protein 59 [Elysia marginata]
MNFTWRLFMAELFFSFCSSLPGVDPGTSVQGIGNSEASNVACKEACRKTFAGLSTSEAEPYHYEGSQEDSCQRGCRFYAIVELLNKTSNHANTLDTCYDNCHDAYLARYKESESCRVGCDHQHPFQMKKSKLDLEIPRSKGRENVVSVLYPIMQIHNLYKSMQKASWSFFAVQDDTGSSGDIVIVQTKRLDRSNMFSKDNGAYSDVLGFSRHTQSKKQPVYTGDVDCDNLLKKDNFFAVDLHTTFEARPLPSKLAVDEI